MHRRKTDPEMPLFTPKGAVRLPVTPRGWTLVDPDVAETLKGMSLCFHDKTGYVQVALGSRGKYCYLHRMVCPAGPGQEIHHVNGDPADNRRANLRALSHSCHKLRSNTNGSPKSGFRGVWPHGKRFQAVVGFRGAEVFSGTFDSAIEAALARDDKACRITGSRQGLNFPFCVNRRHLEGFLRKSNGTIFSVTFRKRTDRTLRMMVCRLGVRKNIHGKGLAFLPGARGLLNVFDMEKREYRFIPLESVLVLTAHGKRYRVVDGKRGKATCRTYAKAA